MARVLAAVAQGDFVCSSRGTSRRSTTSSHPGTCPAQMWSPGEQAFLTDQDLIDFLLRDDVPCPAILREENTVLESVDLPEFELLDKDVDDFINSLLEPFEDKPGMLQDYSLPTSDSSISEYQHPYPSPVSALVSSQQRSNIVQIDHNYSLHQNCFEMENMRSEMAMGHVFTDLGTGMVLEDRSKALELNPVFPVAVGANPLLLPGATVQPDFPGLSEERQLLGKVGTLLPACQPLMNMNPYCGLSLPSVPGPLECFSQSTGSKIQDGALAEHQRVKTARQKIQNEQSAQKRRCRKKSYMEDLEHRLSASVSQNRRLKKKVRVLRKRNVSLFKELQKLKASAREPKTVIVTGGRCSTVTLLTFHFLVSPRVPSSGSRNTKVKIRVVTRRVRRLPNQAAPAEQETTVEDHSLAAGQPQLTIERGAESTQPGSQDFSSSDPSVAVGPQLGHPHPQ